MKIIRALSSTSTPDAHHDKAHGISVHTEHANWKALYTDGSGDEQELTLGANGTFFQSSGAAGVPEFTALVDGDIPATHAGSAHHAVVTVSGTPDYI
ncbi:hypothetical protein LCGC14_1724480, partial [marine sediment metagenome]